MDAGPAEAPIVLIVEDDAEIAGLIVETLRENGFATCAVGSGPAMDQALAGRRFDLMILDLMLPGEDGLSICRRLRTRHHLPIIMVTALGESVDRVVGLEIGADDYLTKPFDPHELVARVRALLRRAHGNWGAPGAARSFHFAGWRVDPATRTVMDPRGVRVVMTTTEFDLLVAFCQNPQQILSREKLLSLTHAGLAGPVSRSVDVHVSRIRQKIDDDPERPSLITTVRLGGYIFTPPVEMRP